MSYTVLSNNKIIGTSNIKFSSCVEKPFKPFSEKIASWNGSDFEYNYGENRNETLEKKYLSEAVFNIGTIINSYAQYCNGSETRIHNGDISVLIPCYKKSEYLMTAVKSCFKQTQKPTKVVVLLMDDDSYALESDLIEMGCTVYKEKQMNVCKARTYLAEKCETDWLIFLDADDFLLRNYIETLDKSDSALCMASNVYLSNEELIYNELDISESDKLERITQQNMTALMHKDLFFDIGLNEDYCKGGEDFDFLLRVALGNKWKISFTSDTNFIYRSDVDGSLTKSVEYFISYNKVIIDNKDLVMKVIENCENPTNELLQIYWYLKNPTEDRLNTLAIKFSLQNPEIYSEFNFFEDYIINQITNLADLSKRKSTDSVYSSSDYEFINTDSADISEMELVNRTFDAVIVCCELNTIEDIVNFKLPLVIRKDIYKEVKEKGMSNIDILIYLLKNYSCFIKKMKIDSFRKKRNSSDEFLRELKNIKFDATIEESAKRLYDGICESMFMTNPPSDKRVITYVLHKKCNMRCDYCNQSHNDPLDDETIFANFEKAIDHFKEILGTSYRVQIMGGEPTIWSEWLQNKIIEKVKEYQNVHILTNGTNKDAPLYKEKRIIKHLHLINWKEELNVESDYDILNLVILTEQDRKDFHLLNNTNKKILPCPCKSTNPYYNLSFEGIKEIAGISCDNVIKSHIGEFIQNCDKLGIEKVRENCRNGTKRVIEVDCTSMKIRPCSNSKFEYDFKDFDFSKTTPESECCNCNYTF